MSFRGRGRGRGRGQQHVDGRELQLVYERFCKQEQEAADLLYKGKWGVRLSLGRTANDSSKQIKEPRASGCR